MAAVTFEVPGKPLAKGRPKFARREKFVTTYTPEKTVNAEAVIRGIASAHFPEPYWGPICLDVLAVFKPPKSWSGVKTKRALGGPHIQKPDGENIAKTIADALNGVAYADDCQIADWAIAKRWGPVEKTIITVRALEDRECA